MRYAQRGGYTPAEQQRASGCGWRPPGGLPAVTVSARFAPVLLAAYLMPSRPAVRRSAFGLLSGAGALLLYLAWVQRAGPGTTCWHTETASGCDQNLNPLPWLLAGIVLFIGGIAAHARRG